MSSFELSLRRNFVADHFHDLPGFVEARHGHNWELEATVRGGSPETGQRLSRALDAWVTRVDYTLLNELDPLKGCNPTTECLAQWLMAHLEASGLEPLRTKVREKANYWASCHPVAR